MAVTWELSYGPLNRYVKLRVAHAPRMFSPPPRVSDPGMHHGTCVSHVPWCMSGSLTSGFLWSRWRGKRSRHSRRMRNPQFYVSGKRPMGRMQMASLCSILQGYWLPWDSRCRIMLNFGRRRTYTMINQGVMWDGMGILETSFFLDLWLHTNSW